MSTPAELEYDSEVVSIINRQLEAHDKMMRADARMTKSKRKRPTARMTINKPTARMMTIHGTGARMPCRKPTPISLLPTPRMSTCVSPGKETDPSLLPISPPSPLSEATTEEGTYEGSPTKKQGGNSPPPRFKCVVKSCKARIHEKDNLCNYCYCVLLKEKGDSGGDTEHDSDNIPLERHHSSNEPLRFA
jgi:hypothetical protein